LLRRILVPLDGSRLGEQALPLAVEIASRLEAGLWLVRVSRAFELTSGPGSFVPSYVERVRELLGGEAHEYLGGLQARLARPGLAVRSVVLEGPVVAAIAGYACAQRIDLIVMATHGRAGLSRWVHHNVAEGVRGCADCPTLLVPCRTDRAAPAARPRAAQPPVR